MKRDYETIIDVIELITIITNEKFYNIMTTDQYAPIIYMEGLCYYFHMILKELFDLDDDSLMISLTGDHIGTLIDGVVYDAVGNEEIELFRRVNSTDLKSINKYFLGDKDFNNELVKIIINDIKKQYSNSKNDRGLVLKK